MGAHPHSERCAALRLRLLAWVQGIIQAAMVDDSR